MATFHVPHPQGSAAGRQLWALAEALRADGHEVEGWCWGPVRAGLDPPDWCESRPYVAKTGWAVRPRTLLRPRADLARAGWRPPEGSVGWADDWASWPAVDRGSGGDALLTVHYDVALDARALGDRTRRGRPARGWSLPLVQDWRAQRRAVRRSTCTVALSERVATSTGVSTVVPATLPMPAAPLPLVDAPVALMFADWSWPANAAALRQLLDGWADVRDRVAGAELLVAGRGAPDVGAAPGVRVVGEVAQTVDAMAQAAVLAFPCPPTSGPKMKVLDALAAGLPVVTTPAGAEGLQVPAAAVAVGPSSTYVDLLVEVLADPGRRAAMADMARGAVLAHHAPAVAARSRVAALVRS
ncbi:MAG: hypothetical protein QOJ03_1918 [Frankiaceae bacterium]|nr:hypothetical protein [Frankiaceae bacterium]